MPRNSLLVFLASLLPLLPGIAPAQAPDTVVGEFAARLEGALAATAVDQDRLWVARDESTRRLDFRRASLFEWKDPSVTVEAAQRMSGEAGTEYVLDLLVRGEARWEPRAYGLATGAIPSKNVPEALERLADGFVRGRVEAEGFQEDVRRVGKATIRASLEDLFDVPGHVEDPGYYSDWGDPREYTTGDMGVGECAGEVVSLVEFGLAEAEREAFEAQLALEERDDPQAAVELSRKAMLGRSCPLSTR